MSITIKAILLFLASFIASVVLATDEYVKILLQCHESGSNPCNVQDINQWGEISGTFRRDGGSVHAFVIVPQHGLYFIDVDGDMINDLRQEIADPNVVDSRGIAINDRLHVAGYAEYQGFSDWIPFLWNGASMPSLENLFTSGSPIPPYIDVNNLDQVVGTKNIVSGDLIGFLWQAGDHVDLGNFGVRRTVATAINDSGQVVGWGCPSNDCSVTKAALWNDPSVAQDLGTLGGENSRAWDINESGVVAGEAETSDGDLRAVIWQGGMIQNLGLLYETDIESYALGINNLGQVVGISVSQNRIFIRGFIWLPQPDPILGLMAGMHDLSDLVVAGSGSVSGAFAINDDGVILSGGAVLIPNGYVPPTRPEELRLVGLEVVQSIQDWTNSVALVEGKQTFVRVHFESEDTMHFVPFLHGVRSSVELPESPLVLANKSVTFQAHPDAQTMRGDLESVPYFELPKEWVTADLELTVETTHPNLVCVENAGPVASDCSVAVTFEPTETLELKIVRVQFEEAGEKQALSELLALELARRVESAFPISSIDLQVDLWEWPGPGPPDTATVMDVMAWNRVWDHCLDALGCRRLYYGAILMDGIDGIGQLSGTAAAGFVPRDPLAEGRHTHSHEIGHNLNRDHPTDPSFGFDPFGFELGACCSDSDGSAPIFPTFEQIGQPNNMCSSGESMANGLRPALGDLDQGVDSKVYGLDSTLKRIVDPNEIFAMMSYCSKPGIDLWPSKFHYEAIRQEINNRFARPIIQLTGIPQDHLGIRGTVEGATGKVELLPIGRIPGLQAAPSNPPAGNFDLVIKDGAGSVLQTLAFEPIPYVARGGNSHGSSFAIFVPVDPSIKSVEVKLDDQLQALSTATLHPPSITVISPNGGELLTEEDVSIEWTSSDLDGDSLVHVVQFSADNGTSWKTLASDWVADSLTIGRSELTKTSEGLIRVQVSDGFNTATDESDGLFSVANNPPVLMIFSPTINPTFTGDQLILFQASAFDREDGSLPDSSYSWESSLDDSMGAGNSLSIMASSLSAGLHTITTTATDSDGATATASVPIYIGFEGLFFIDGFESGDTSAWSASQ